MRPDTFLRLDGLPDLRIFGLTLESSFVFDGKHHKRLVQADGRDAIVDLGIGGGGRQIQNSDE